MASLTPGARRRLQLIIGVFWVVGGLGFLLLWLTDRQPTRLVFGLLWLLLGIAQVLVLRPTKRGSA